MNNHRQGTLKENLLAQALERSIRKALEHRQMWGGIGATLIGGILLTSLVLLQRRQVHERTWQMLSLAQNQVMQGQLNQGISTLNDLLARYHSGPALEQAYQLLGSLYMASGNAQQAVKAYEDGLKSISQESNRPLLKIGLAAAYEDAGIPAKAIETYNAFLKEFPEHYLTPRVLLSLIRLQSSKNNPDAARESYEKLLTLYPDTSWTKRAGAYFQTKDNSTAK